MIALLAAGRASMLFAVLEARPRSRRLGLRSGCIEPTRGGLLLFSEFAGMDCELERKYALLRLSYSALAVGIVVAFALHAAAFVS